MQDVPTDIIPTLFLQFPSGYFKEEILRLLRTENVQRLTHHLVAVNASINGQLLRIEMIHMFMGNEQILNS